MKDLALDNPAWTFCLKLYRSPGVADELLRLQDEIGLDVSFLLFCVWLGAERAVVLSAAEMERAQASVAPWTALVVQRLRAARRGIKARPEMARPAVAAFRAKLQRLEIEAEQIQIGLLFDRAESGTGASAGSSSGEGRAEAAVLNLGVVLGLHGANAADVGCVHLRKVVASLVGSAPDTSPRRRGP